MNEKDQNEKAKISLRCWQFQRDAWQEAADSLNISMSEYLIKKIDSPFSLVDDANINEIKVSQISTEMAIAEIKMICEESGTFTEEQYRNILNALKNNSEKIDELIELVKGKSGDDIADAEAEADAIDEECDDEVDDECQTEQTLSAVRSLIEGPNLTAEFFKKMKLKKEEESERNNH